MSLFDVLPLINSDTLLRIFLFPPVQLYNITDFASIILFSVLKVFGGASPLTRHMAIL